MVVDAGFCPPNCICDNIHGAVSCIRKQLTEIPITIPEATKKLDVRGNNIKVIENGAFYPIPYLTHLNLQKCKLQRLAEGAFRGLGRLIYLNVGFNDIEFIYQETFDGLSSLQQLIIDNNKIEEISPGSFTQLGFLNFLNLGENMLVYLPNMLFQGLLQIRYIRLSKNMVNNIADEAFAGLWTLKRLSLDSNELQYFPSEALSRMTEVTRLDLGGNPMTYLGEEAVRMRSLKHLSMENMSLQDMSLLAFQWCPKLTVLDLQYNQLRSLQPLVGVETLRKVNLTGNPIQCNCFMRPFREWISNYTNLKAEVFCRNPGLFRGERLDSLRPVDLRCDSQQSSDYEEEENQEPEESKVKTGEEHLPCPEHCDCKHDLQHSSCEGKLLRKIPKGFPKDSQLLDMRHNDFQVVPRNAFMETKHLVSLHLQSCRIHDVQPGAFRALAKLVYLYLSGNEISSLEPSAFEGLPQLTYLYLDLNKLTSVPKGSFKLLPNLFALHLEHNPIPLFTAENVEGAENVRWLYLTGTNLTYVEPNALAAVQGLQKLFLDENKLSEVPTEALRGLHVLDELKLSRNPIRQIGSKAFLPVSDSLQHLWLDNMGVEEISDGAFAGLGAGLKSLHLDHNKLSHIPNLKQFRSLDTINLSNNPLNCDCRLLHLRRWIESSNLKVTATCALPKDAAGLDVKFAPFKNCNGTRKAVPAANKKKKVLKRKKSRSMT
eukprot:gi/632981755/ref/XP_007907764.1/ PREDICTED: chondroadherin-like protein [Callorhinchus milii]